MEFEYATELAKRKARDWEGVFAVWSLTTGVYTVAPAERTPHNADKICFIAYDDGSEEDPRQAACEPVRETQWTN